MGASGPRVEPSHRYRWDESGTRGVCEREGCGIVVTRKRPGKDVYTVIDGKPARVGRFKLYPGVRCRGRKW